MSALPKKLAPLLAVEMLGNCLAFNFAPSHSDLYVNSTSNCLTLTLILVTVLKDMAKNNKKIKYRLYKTSVSFNCEILAILLMICCE